MDNFPANSRNIAGPNKEKKESKELPKKELEKIVSGEVIQKKVPISKRFKHIFFGGEFKGATAYIATEVLLPAVKNMVVDATTKGIERVIYGDSSPRRSAGYGRPRVSYDRMASRRHPAILPDQPPLPHRREERDRRPGIGEVILVSRDEAQLVLDTLIDIIDTYEFASVADLYDLAGLPTTYVDNKWGWGSLQYAEVRQVREGYLLDLPNVEPIE